MLRHVVVLLLLASLPALTGCPDDQPAETAPAIDYSGAYDVALRTGLCVTTAVTESNGTLFVTHTGPDVRVVTDLSPTARCGGFTTYHGAIDDLGNFDAIEELGTTRISGNLVTLSGTLSEPDAIGLCDPACPRPWDANLFTDGRTTAPCSCG